MKAKSSDSSEVDDELARRRWELLRVLKNFLDSDEMPPETKEGLISGLGEELLAEVRFLRHQNS